MLVTESVTINKREFVHNYSDNGMLIEQVESGDTFVEAFDVPSATFTYRETDKPVDPVDPDPTIEEKAAAYDILVGGNTDDNN